MWIEIFGVRRLSGCEPTTLIKRFGRRPRVTAKISLSLVSEMSVSGTISKKPIVHMMAIPGLR